MEANTQRRGAGLREKLPELNRSLDTVRFLRTRKPDSEPTEVTFELNDTLYAKAIIPPTDEVYLWLGANVMLSYPAAEAETLLESKLSVAQQSLANCEEDLDFLREQITDEQTLEVATARVYNWDITQKRKEMAERGEDGGENNRTLPNG
ncbi:sterol 3-beta-glucosyltransferase [Physcia stellaris]|nr:sterol 3-beta-glucosyltransferase [Physcia stellaris]